VSRPFLLTVSALFLAACAGSAPSSGGGTTASASPERAALIARIDSIVNKPIASGKIAGASVAVVKGQDTILIKGYGKADLEFDVATPQDAIYEIGSVTKQFTAASILLLAEQGKLSLDDDITKYFPGYNSQGNKIIRRLLTTLGHQGLHRNARVRPHRPDRRPSDTLVGLSAEALRLQDRRRRSTTTRPISGRLIIRGERQSCRLRQGEPVRQGGDNSRYCERRRQESRAWL
jgi:CubicO group peptidase (beta-lactamase class C family)